MASYGWRKNRSVAESLFEEGHLFELHQALRLLESLYRDRVPVGEEVDPSREVVRFRSAVRFDFPSSDVEEIKLPEDGQPAEMVVNVLSTRTPRSTGAPTRTRSCAASGDCRKG